MHEDGASIAKHAWRWYTLTEPYRIVQ